MPHLQEEVRFTSREGQGEGVMFWTASVLIVFLDMLFLITKQHDQSIIYRPLLLLSCVLQDP